MGAGAWPGLIELPASSGGPGSGPDARPSVRRVSEVEAGKGTVDERSRIPELGFECLQGTVADRIAGVPALHHVADHALVKLSVHLVMARELCAGEQTSVCGDDARVRLHQRDELLMGLHQAP